MLIFQFHHYIKPAFVEAYKAAILQNACLTVQEESVIRFDVFQDKEDPIHFSLLDIYRDQQAREPHLQTKCFLRWKDIVLGQHMFANIGKGDEFEMLFPED